MSLIATEPDASDHRSIIYNRARAVSYRPERTDAVLRLKETLIGAGLPVTYIAENLFASSGYVVRCEPTPWDQYNRDCQPGSWGRTILPGETAEDCIASYRRAYGEEQ